MRGQSTHASAPPSEEKRKGQTPWLWDALLALILGAVILGYRAQIVHQPPWTDEGSYLALAWTIGSLPHNDVPDLTPSPLAAYPALIAPAIATAENPLLLARYLDAAINAALGACLFLCFRQLTSRTFAFTIALAFSAALNSSVFIDAGNKNPSALSFLLLNLVALIFLRRSTTQPRIGRWWLAGMGALLAGAVLVRETAILQALLLLGATFLACGTRSALTTLAGSVLAGAMALLVICLQRGGNVGAQIHGMIASYAHLPALYERVAKPYDLAAHRQNLFALVFSTTGWFVVTTGAAALAGLILGSIRPPRTRHVIILLIGLGSAAIALPEPILKLGFPYHLSFGFYGLAYAAAAGFGILEIKWGIRPALVLLAGIGLVGVAVPSGRGTSSIALWLSGANSAIQLSHQYRQAVEGNWSDPAIENSFYLATAKELRTRSSPDDTLLVSGFYQGLYPLSRLRPWHADCLDLLVMTMKQQPPKITGIDSPTFFVQSNRYPEIDLTSCFDDFARDYELVAEVSNRPHYSIFNAKIWKRRARH